MSPGEPDEQQPGPRRTRRQVAGRRHRSGATSEAAEGSAPAAGRTWLATAWEARGAPCREIRRMGPHRRPARRSGPGPPRAVALEDGPLPLQQDARFPSSRTCASSAGPSRPARGAPRTSRRSPRPSRARGRPRRPDRGRGAQVSRTPRRRQARRRSRGATAATLAMAPAHLDLAGHGGAPAGTRDPRRCDGC